VTISDPARRVACDVLVAVEQQDAYANLLLPALLRERSLTGRDAAFATELAYGTLRFLGTYDAILTACSARPVAEMDVPLRAALRLGVHQLLGMRVATHAAVSTTVTLAREAAGARVAGFANAVMRAVAKRDRDEWFAALAPKYDDDPVGHVAFVHGHPRWIVEVYRDALGGDVEEAARMCAADNVAPSVHLVARPGRCNRDELLAQAGPNAHPGTWSAYAVVLDGGDPGSLPLIRSGAAGVQDEGSQLVALAVAEAHVDHDARWLDLCAGPGGKAALLAGLAGQRGAVLVAADRAPHRARLARQAVGDNHRVAAIAADGQVAAWQAAAFDRVLVDAPCTGLGALRRRPDARWRRRPEDAARLQDLQVALLHAGVDAARSGGIVGYVTCSPHPVETAGVVSRVINGRADVFAETPTGTISELPDVDTAFGIQLWPHRHGTDAMYLALLRRTDSAR
jgi:16S rRNA (cytosine967-C5)-methyltransferase